MPPHQPFNTKNFRQICSQLARVDSDLQTILDCYGYPPLWKRRPGFETLVQIILEQQVSLASAKAAHTKLKEKITSITPQTFLLLTDEELKACYFSRQKILYTKHLAHAIHNGQLNLKQFKVLDNVQIRSQLVQIKGIGSWTADVYLMMAMQRADLFPLGDIALINSIKMVKKLEPGVSILEIAKLAESWKPYRTIAAYMLWHAYLGKRKSLV